MSNLKESKTMNNLMNKMMLLAGIATLAVLPGVRADQWDQKTVLKISEPLEIPGQVLPAGTYVLKLANSQTSRHIVQVFTQGDNRLLGTFLAIPSHRHQPSDKTILRYEERPAGSPQAIKAWFYPGKTYGHEFVYPKNEAVDLAKANNMPVPAMPMEFITVTTMAVIDFRGPEIAAMAAAPLKAEEPSGQEVELASLTASPDAAPELPEELPSTASAAPLIGLIGLASLGTAFVLRRRASN
jgi:LPXTG-motif cell wall-anchored protein